MSRGRRAVWRWSLAATALVVAGSTVVVAILRAGAPPRPPGCIVNVGSASYPLDSSQAANAATISSVAVRLRLSDHAVTVALATALQESKLHNLSYGDRDSVGLFQQRPSQGWGLHSQLLDPHFAATAFFSHLVHVPGWQTMSVADAAQAVQRSVDGSAYAGWESEARIIAQALTGEVPHGIACFYAKPDSTSRGLTAALVRDIGINAVGVPVPVKTGWMTASWLVAQAAQYSIDTVTFDGQRWTRSSGGWSSHRAPSVVNYSLMPSPGS